MLHEFISELVVDPLEKYDGFDKERIVQSCGIIPMWVCNPEFMGISLVDSLKTQYQFPMNNYWNLGGTLDPDGTFNFTDDPPSYPLMKIIRGNEIFYMYEYAQVIIIQENGKIYKSRMD